MSLYTSNMLHKSSNPTKAYMMNCYPASVMLSERGGLLTAVQQRVSLSFDLFHGVLQHVLVLRCCKIYWQVLQHKPDGNVAIHLTLCFICLQTWETSGRWILIIRFYLSIGLTSELFSSDYPIKTLYTTLIYIYIIMHIIS